MNLYQQKFSREKSRTQAFTLVEVALSLGIIAIALLAIIGILPTGMQVQKDNREETIVTQDGQFLLEVIKQGRTNVVSLADNLEWIKIYTNNVLDRAYYRSNLLNGTYTSNQVATIMVGAMSFPRFTIDTNQPTGYISNWVEAKFVSHSGPLSDRAIEPRDFAFSYLVNLDIVPAIQTPSYSNAYPDIAYQMNSNLYELRLTMRWPVYPNGSTGLGKKSFRTMIAGKLEQDTNQLYYFKPNNFMGVN